jgi:TonB family protein
MFIKSIITGSLITAILVSVLAATRLMKTDSDALDLLLYEVEQITMTPPAEPPMDDEEEPEEEEPLENLPQAPIPALDLIADVSIESTPLPLTTATFDPQLSVSPFEIDREPAELPVAKAPSRPKSVVKPSSKPKAKYKRPTPPREKVKPYYSPSELDRMPRELRMGSYTWPNSARGTSGTVKLLLEINTSGKVLVISVLSNTDPKLISAAKRVATNSRFTAPTYRGKPVKTKFYKTYHLKKPRR